ncbi:DUF3987 domain-containing protein [Synechococcus sp. CB0101]|uniref:DUF3987 domain-containing protein n=1 Tax=Synechococcus sp. CB0101 TaxID=232348 RepID=UPI00049725BB|nr:DUF3987 domain-containing protein [Synechococcus sp. CB0101]QCH14378.1 DUF3987 domain-containing protein [Synechococcus sp. CB0101]
MPQDFTDWRHYLPQLDGFPLLPVGAGVKGKSPIDPATGKGLAGWQTKRFTPDQIAAMNGVVKSVGTLTGPQADHTAFIDIDGALCIERCKHHGCTTKELGWTVRRTTAKDRLKVPFHIPEELRHYLQDSNGNPIGKVVLTIKPAVYDLDADGKPKRDNNGRPITLEPAQQIELFYGSGQCIVLGEHVESKGHYTWTGSPIQMGTPTPEWWALITEVLEAGAAEAKAARKTSHGSGAVTQSGPHHACRICGRNTSGACTEYSDGERVRINCFQGQTFSPPTGHGLKEGHTVTINGTTWAFCGHGFNPSIGSFATFAEHIQRTPEPAAEPSGVAQGDVQLYDTEWLKQQLRECLEEGLSDGEMAVEVDRLAVKADVHTSRVEKLLAGLRADDAAAETIADVSEVIQQIEEAEAAVYAIRLHDFLPATLCTALQTIQQGIPYPDITLLMAQLTHISSCIKLGTRINGNPFTDWEVPANLFHIDVGPSGARKSPLIKAVFTKPSTDIRQQLSRLNAQRYDAWEAECAGKKQNKPPAPLAIVHSTNSYTGEALTERLEAHEHHKQPLLIQRDEIAGLFDSWGKYKQGGKGTGGDEQQLLELFDGDGHHSIRVGRGRAYDRCHVSLHGGIQDAVLRRLIAAGDDNGKWARCTFAPLPEMTYRLPVFSEEAAEQRRQSERTLQTISTALFTASPKTYFLDAAGVQMLADYDHLCQLQRNESRVPAIKALKNKAAAKAMRLACLLHLTQCQAADHYDASVPSDRLALAITLVDALDAWAASFHATAALNAQEANALADRNRIAQRIHEIAAKHKGYVPWTTIRRSLKGAEKKGITNAMAHVVLQQLCNMGIGTTKEGTRGGISYRALGPFPQ